MHLTHLWTLFRFPRTWKVNLSDGRGTSNFIFEIIILINNLWSNLIPQTIKKLDLLDDTFYDALNINTLLWVIRLGRVFIDFFLMFKTT